MTENQNPSQVYVNVPNIAVMLGKLPTFDGKTYFKKFLNAILRRARLERWNDEDIAQIV